MAVLLLPELGVSLASPRTFKFSSSVHGPVSVSANCPRTRERGARVLAMEVVLRHSQGLPLASRQTTGSLLVFEFLSSFVDCSVSANLHVAGQTRRKNLVWRLASAPMTHSGMRHSISGSNEESLDPREMLTDRDDPEQWDVSSNCVKPAFRVSPLASPRLGIDGKKAHILFLSEGNVCRSVYAEAIMKVLLRRHGLQDVVSCSSKATRDYNLGEAIDPRAALVAGEQGLELEKEKVATIFECSSDIVHSDIILVMDKFTASDALKEITVYEIINKNGLYANKVRRLGEFCKVQHLEDIEDPLYGNMGGEQELESVREVYQQVRTSCEGLIDYILDVQANLQELESLSDGIARALGRMGALNWLAPPMLSKI